MAGPPPVITNGPNSAGASGLRPAQPTSMSQIILNPLNNLQDLARTLFLSLSPAQTRPPPPPPLDAFLAADAELASALQLARIHQMNQRRIEELKAEVFGLEVNLREIWVELESGKRELQTLIEDGEERIEAIKKANEAALPYPELLTYAQNISAFTSAPPNLPEVLPGQAPPPLFFPPFPNEEKMRRGRLNAEAPLGILGETHSVGKPPGSSPTKPAAEPGLPVHNPYRPDHRPQQIFDVDLDLNPEL